MASFRLTIAGIERALNLDSLSVQHVVNGPDILEGRVQDVDGALPLALDDVVELIQTDVVPEALYFSGFLNTKQSETWSGWGFGRLRRITAFDKSVQATYVSVFNLQLGQPGLATIGEVLAALVSQYLADYGITVDPSQAAGPAVEANIFDGQTVAAVLNALSEQTGWVWKITPQNTIRMWNPAAEAAGFNVTATNGTYLEDIRTDQLRQRYYNRVFVEGGSGYWPNVLEETHYGDGVTRTFPMDAPMVYWENDYTGSLGIWVGLTIRVVRAGVTTVEYVNDQGTAQWTFVRGPAYALTQVAGATLLPGEYIIIGSHEGSGYSAQWPMRLVADGRGVPPEPARDLRLVRPAIFGRAAIQAVADQVLAASQVEYDRAVYITERIDCRPGQTQTIDVPEAGINGTYTCVSSRLAYVPEAAPGDRAFRIEITAVNAITAQSFWLDLYSRWIRDNSGTTTVIPPSAPPSGPGPSPSPGPHGATHVPGAIDPIPNAAFTNILNPWTAAQNFPALTVSGLLQNYWTDAATNNVVEFRRTIRDSTGVVAVGFGAKDTVFLKKAGALAPAWERESTLASITAGLESVATVYRQMVQGALQPTLLIGADGAPTFQRYLTGTFNSAQAAATFRTKKGVGATVADGAGAKLFCSTDDNTGATFFLGGLSFIANFTTQKSSVALVLKNGPGDLFATTTVLTVDAAGVMRFNSPTFWAGGFSVTVTANCSIPGGAGTTLPPNLAYLDAVAQVWPAAGSNYFYGPVVSAGGLSVNGGLGVAGHVVNVTADVTLPQVLPSSLAYLNVAQSWSAAQAFNGGLSVNGVDWNSWFNQSVRTDAAPTFAGLTLNGNLSLTGNIHSNFSISTDTSFSAQGSVGITVTRTISGTNLVFKGGILVG